MTGWERRGEWEVPQRSRSGVGGNCTQDTGEQQCQAEHGAPSHPQKAATELLSHLNKAPGQSSLSAIFIISVFVLH